MAVRWSRPYEAKGGVDGQWDFIRQDGVIYAWSESNGQYERAWWLESRIPAQDLPQKLSAEIRPYWQTTELETRLLLERPLPEGEWIKFRGRDTGATSDA